MSSKFRVPMTLLAASVGAIQVNGSVSFCVGICV